MELYKYSITLHYVADNYNDHCHCSILDPRGIGLDSEGKLTEAPICYRYKLLLLMLTRYFIQVSEPNGQYTKPSVLEIACNRMMPRFKNQLFLDMI